MQIRDTAILTMLFETGIRCWELCCIQKSDIHEDFIIIQREESQAESSSYYA